MKKLIFTLLSIMSCTALFAAVPAEPVLLDATARETTSTSANTPKTPKAA